MFIWHSTEAESQKGSEISYVGGVPMLPRGMDIPIFEITGTQMTFFFQLALPPGHVWEKRIVSVFSATDYVDDNSHIPKIPPSPAQADLNAAFFRDYQTFFRTIVFDEDCAEKAIQYSEMVSFRHLKLAETRPPDCVIFGEINIEPKWILEDEAPRSFNGNHDAFEFLFQTKLDYAFETIERAPKQKVIDYAAGSGLADSENSAYTLFTSNELYFFGMRAEPSLIYVVPQS